MHPDLLQRVGSMKGELTALRKPVMAAVGSYGVGLSSPFGFDSGFLSFGGFA